jgi:hypothetical protein
MDLRLYYAKGDEFKTLTELLKERVSSMLGFVLPGFPAVDRFGVRVTSKVLGSSPPFSIEYTIESTTSTGFNLYPQGQGPNWAQRYPTLFWEAAGSSEFYREMVRQNQGFVDGGAKQAITVSNVPGVAAARGRLLLLLPGTLPPSQPTEPAKGILLSGVATAFRIMPIGFRLPPDGIEFRESLTPELIPR